MEYFCHIWPEEAQSSLSRLSRVQNNLCSLVGVDLFSNLQLWSLQRYNLLICMTRLQMSSVLYISQRLQRITLKHLFLYDQRS